MVVFFFFVRVFVRVLCTVGVRMLVFVFGTGWVFGAVVRFLWMTVRVLGTILVFVRMFVLLLFHGLLFLPQVAFSICTG